MNSLFRLAPIVLLGLAGAAATAAPINQVAPGTLTGTQLTTFDDVAGGGAPGTNYDGVFVSGGVSFAERFAGQTNAPSGGFDVLSGTPTAALSLAVGSAGQNLNIFINGASQVLTGLGPAGFPNFDAIGEGSFAALFSTDQSEFGFDLVGGNGGTAFVNFFRRDGSLIDTISLGGLSDQSYAFTREGGVFDIAGISIHNNDLAGIGFDNLRFNVRSGGAVPEPSTLMLMALALLCMSRVVRRKI
jgi:PEP-CTERM motif